MFFAFHRFLLSHPNIRVDESGLFITCKLKDLICGFKSKNIYYFYDLYMEFEILSSNKVCKRCKKKAWFFTRLIDKNMLRRQVNKKSVELLLFDVHKNIVWDICSWRTNLSDWSKFWKIHFILIPQGTFKKKVAQIPGFPLLLTTNKCY